MAGIDARALDRNTAVVTIGVVALVLVGLAAYAATARALAAKPAVLITAGWHHTSEFSILGVRLC